MDVNRPSVVEQAVRQDGAEAELRAIHRGCRHLELRRARLLARIDWSHHYAYRGCSSIAQFGEMIGLSGREARMLAAVGRVVERSRKVEEKILSGELSLDAAAALARVFDNPVLSREGDDWLALALRVSAKAFEFEVRKRIREVESGEPVSSFFAVLTCTGREKYERARRLASRKAQRLLSDGQTVEVLADHYLDSFDPERRQRGTRRMPHTAGLAGRHVPAEVSREVIARQGDRCAVPECDHDVFLDRAHIRPHRAGGSREADNLIYLCRQHHVLFDLGLLRIAGPPDAPVFSVPEPP